MSEPGAGDASNRGKKGSGSSTQLLDALEAFVVEKSKKATLPKPEQLTFWQEVLKFSSLFLFCANVIVGYLSITSLLPSLDRQPLWTAIGKIVPLIVGSTLLVSWAGGIQAWILKVSSRWHFFMAVAGCFVVIGLLGITQLPQFSVAISPNNEASSFCVESVDDLDDVRFAALRPAVNSNPPCAKPQIRGTRYLKSLRLLQDYGITVFYGSSNPDHYFLSKWAVLARALRFRQSPLALGSLGTLTLPATKQDGAVLHIRPEEKTGVFYVPSDVHCDVDDQEIRCRTRKDAVINVSLMPGYYSIKSDKCQVTPDRIYLIENNASSVECK